MNVDWRWLLEKNNTIIIIKLHTMVDGVCVCVTLTQNKVQICERRIMMWKKNEEEEGGGG